ncbi:hypothetical protein HW555_014223 [Spodoptera exigua]|uniref:Uncharacterized protein n=1 Tax=Spodoptera exigua TaxID=7107 RepID=A0A835L1P7_SPOEX|nr:hypothetical protein HW555_014223 [Spodoptera exigua]
MLSHALNGLRCAMEGTTDGGARGGNDLPRAASIYMDLEEAVDNPSEQYAEREEFEKLYYALVASSRQLISGARGHLVGDSASE